MALFLRRLLAPPGPEPSGLYLLSLLLYVELRIPRVSVGVEMLFSQALSIGSSSLFFFASLFAPNLSLVPLLCRC